MINGSQLHAGYSSRARVVLIKVEIFGLFPVRKRMAIVAGEFAGPIRFSSIPPTVTARKIVVIECAAAKQPVADVLANAKPKAQPGSSLRWPKSG